MKELNKYFVPYKQALKLKELGFDEDCFAAYFKYTASSNELENIELLTPKTEIYGANYFFNNKDEWFIDNSISGDGDGAKCTAPIFSQAFAFFREKYNLHSHIYPDLSYHILGGVANTYNDAWDIDSKKYEKYEEAQLECVNELIQICFKTKQYLNMFCLNNNHYVLATISPIKAGKWINLTNNTIIEITEEDIPEFQSFDETYYRKIVYSSIPLEGVKTIDVIK